MALFRSIMASTSKPPTEYADGEDYIVRRSSSVSFSINHPKPISTTLNSIRLFLCQYDQYSEEGKARALQLAVIYSTTTELVRPVKLTYCVDDEYLESSIEMDYISGVESTAEHTDDKLRKCLEPEADEDRDS